MNLMINDVDFNELETERYWTHAKNYKKDKKKEIHEMILSGKYLGSRKVDGYYYRFIKSNEGDIFLQSRSRGVNGSFTQKIGHVPHLHKFFGSLPNGTCLLGEIFFEGNEGSSNITKIMGCGEDKAIQRQETGQKLNYYIFDVWAFNGESMLGHSAEKRFELIETLSKEYTDEYVEWAEYTKGEELFELLGIVLAADKEGIVITKADSKPEPGKRTARKTLKIKKELSETIDCFFTGVYTQSSEDYKGKNIEDWEYWKGIDTGKKYKGKLYESNSINEPIKPITKGYYNEWAGALEIGVLKVNEVVSIGYLSGLTDEIKANPLDYKDRVIEVTAMEITEDKALRHGKLVRFRDDINRDDCTFEKVFNEN